MATRTIIQPENGHTALGSGRFEADVVSTGSESASFSTVRLFGAASAARLSKDDAVYAALLPVMGPVLVSPAGWRVTPRTQLVLPRVQGMDVCALETWQASLREQVAPMYRRSPGLLQDTAAHLASMLEGHGYVTLKGASGTPALETSVRLASAALTMTLSRLYPQPGPAAPHERATLKLGLNVALLRSGQVRPEEVEPWGPSFWPYLWHPALKDPWGNPSITVFKTRHQEYTCAYPWQDEKIMATLKDAVAQHARQAARTLQYRAEESAQNAALQHGLRDAAKTAAPHSPATGSQVPQNRFQLSLQEAGDAVRAVLGGTEHPKKDSVQGAVTSWLSAWGALDTLLPELRHVRSACRLNLDPKDAERLSVRLAAYNPAPAPGRPYGQVTVNVMNASRASQEDLTRTLARLIVGAALSQPSRGQGREQVLWSAASAMITEHWFDELRLPPLSGDLDPQPTRDAELEKLGSAEAIYAELLRRQVRVRTLCGSRGPGLSDFISPDENAARSLDEEEEAELRTRIGNGLEEAAFLKGASRDHHGGLLRELWAAAAEPVAWRPALLEWASPHYPRPERRARWDRLSRRTSSDPSMALPSFRGEDRSGVSIAVIIDTSASMDDETLQEGLGAIMQTCLVLEVGNVRLISCDTLATDHGPVTPWNLTRAVRLTGGGGTSLQDGVALLDQAAVAGDARFPAVPLTTPLLILTDGYLWETVSVTHGRAHAWLMPKGGRLPFHTTAPVFTIRRR